jgi:hypothetical protein
VGDDNQSTLYSCMKIEEWNPLKILTKRGEGDKRNRGREHD